MCVHNNVVHFNLHFDYGKMSASVSRVDKPLQRMIDESSTMKRPGYMHGKFNHIFKKSFAHTIKQLIRVLQMIM